MLKTTIALACLLLAGGVYSQTTTNEVPEDISAPIPPLKFNLNSSGTRYVRLFGSLQTWATLNDNNEGTLKTNGQPLNGYSGDFGIRRARIMMQAKLNPKFQFVMDLGFNNQSFASGGGNGTTSSPSNSGGTGTADGGKRPIIYFLDLYLDYTMIGNQLHLGTGLHYFNGISRLTNASTNNLVALDIPTFSFPNIDNTDQFGRQLGVFAKGELGKLAYRVAINKPFSYGVSATDPTKFKTAIKNDQAEVLAVNVLTDNYSYSGYFDWKFKDKESSDLPFMTSSYLGDKNIFNIGAGFYYHPNSTGALNSPTGNSVVLYDQVNLGVDVFLDKPLSNKALFNLYSVFFYNDFGPNYNRSLGPLNPYAVASGTGNSAVGGGNSELTIGTGQAWYTCVGYGLPKLKTGARVMPYVAVAVKNYERVDKTTAQPDMGVNYFINGHNIKITGEYSLRPTYVYDQNQNMDYDGMKGRFTLQFHGSF